MFGNAVCLAFIHRERERPGRPGPCSVFTGGLADHAIRFGGFFGNPADVVFDVVKVHAHRWLARPLGIARFAGDAGAPRAVVAIGNRDSGLLDIRIELARCDLEAADGNRFAEGHGVHRAFIRFAPDFILRCAHDETANGQYHHFRAMLAVLEDRARWCGWVGLGQCGYGTGKQGGEGQVIQWLQLKHGLWFHFSEWVLAWRLFARCPRRAKSCRPRVWLCPPPSSRAAAARR